MPMATDLAVNDRLLRIFAYGREKSKKTWWAARACELGFNTILINGEKGGTQIVKNIPAKAREKLLIVNVVNTPTRAIFAAFMANLCRPGNVFTWDEQDSCTIFGLRNIQHSFVEFDVTKLTENDVVIIDSWTTLAASVFFAYAIEHKIDLTNAAREEWDGFGWEGRFLDFVLNSISTWPCHVIVIGHAVVYEKYNDKKGSERKLLSATTQPISSSGPHASKVCNKFNDVLYFDRAANSSEIFTINTGGTKNSSGGSRIMPPLEARWEEIGIEKFFSAVGIKSSNAPCLGARFIDVGTEQILPGQKPKLVLTQTSSESVIKNEGMAQPIAPPPVLEAKGGLLSRMKK